MFNSSNQAIFEPGYIFLLLIALRVLYIVYLILVISRVKLDVITIPALSISVFTYLLTGFYMAGTGYYLDEPTPKNLVFEGLGFPELTLLAFPYIFLSLAASLGEKKRK